MKIAYIAHPINGNIKSNLANIIRIVREINISESGTVPFVPYYADILALDDNNLLERNRGIINDIELLERGFVDEIRLYGSKISKGMIAEIKLAKKHKIPIRAMNYKTVRDYKKLF